MSLLLRKMQQQFRWAKTLMPSLLLLMGLCGLQRTAHAQYTIVTPPNTGSQAGASGLSFTWTVPSPAPGATIGGYMQLNASAHDCCSTATIRVNGSPPPSGLPYSFGFWATASATYSITVTSDSGVDVGLGWEFHPSPPNDNFASAVDLSAAPNNPNGGSLSGDDGYATLEASEPFTLTDVWYKWTAPANGTFTLGGTTPGGSAFFHSVAYAGTSLTNLTNVSGPENAGGLSFQALAGTTYYIAVNAEARGFSFNWNFHLNTITVSVDPGTFSEAAGANAATGTVTLNATIGVDVSVSLTTSNANLATVNPATITIPAGQTSATFGVGAVDNAVAGANAPVTITASAPNIAPASSAVNVTDDDTAGIVVTPTSGLTTNEAGGTATFTVKLSSQPTAAVAIGLSSNKTTEGTVAPAALTFGPDNWNVEQTVTVTGVADHIADADQTFTIVTVPANSGDPNYNGRNADDVTVINSNVDVAQLAMTINGKTDNLVSITEGATASVKITRNTPTTSALTVKLQNGNPDIHVPASVVIPAGQTSVTFTIATTNDAVAQGDRSTTILAIATGSYSVYKTLNVLDNDVVKIGLSVSPTTFAENGKATATITRNTPNNKPMYFYIYTDDFRVADIMDSSGKRLQSATIPAGSNSTTFTVVGTRDNLVTGPRHTKLNGQVTPYIGGPVGSYLIPVDLTVTNVDVLLPPTVTSISPTTAAPGSLITILGTHLGGATVKFGTLAAVNSTFSSDTALFVTVPNAAAGSKLAVTVQGAGGTATNKPIFTVLAVPTKTYTLSGSVLQGTTPVSAAKVLLIPTSGTPTPDTIQSIALGVLRSPTSIKQVFVDIKGNYNLSGLAPGTYLVAPYRPGTPFTAAPFKAGAPLVPYAVKTVTNADIANVNFLAQAADSSKPNITVTNPTSSTPYLPANVPTATGSATDTGGGVLGVGVSLAQYSLTSTFQVSFYNWTTNKFDSPVTLSFSANPLSLIKPEEVKIATLTGSTWSLALPKTLSAGSYRVLPLAVDKAYNLGYPSILSTQGNFSVINSAHSIAAAAPVSSGVKLSGGGASVRQGSVTLKFVGALDGDSAGDASHYTVRVNGATVNVESASYNANSQSVTLSLPEGVLHPGDSVSVQWNGVLDAGSKVLNGQSQAYVAR